MAAIKVPAQERGTTRVFSLSMTQAEARKLQNDCRLQAAALGLQTLNPEGVEVFALSDLGDLGLSGYLRDGVDAQDADLRRDRAKLAALDGWVMLVHSMAFDGAAADIETTAPLTLIGTYAQTPADAPQIDLPGAAALPYSGHSDGQDAPKGAGPGPRGSMIVLLGLVGIALLLWWLLT